MFSRSIANEHFCLELKSNGYIQVEAFGERLSVKIPEHKATDLFELLEKALTKAYPVTRKFAVQYNEEGSSIIVDAFNKKHAIDKFKFQYSLSIKRVFEIVEVAE